MIRLLSQEVATLLMMVLTIFVFTILVTVICALLLTGRMPVIDLLRMTCSISDIAPTQLNPFAAIPDYEKGSYSVGRGLFDQEPTWNSYDFNYLGRPLQSWQCPPIVDL